MKFQGTDTYVATKALQVAVNAAIHLQKPLIVKGEPGTGKTLLAQEIAQALGRKKEECSFHLIKSKVTTSNCRVRKGYNKN